jgi:hypothetical protein
LGRKEIMRKSVIVVEIPANIEELWKIVTDNYQTKWRSDLSKVEVLSDKEFVEYTTSGIATQFTITAKEPFQYYEFTFGNGNIAGVWRVRFIKIKEKLTRLEFTEEIKFKNKFMEIISYLLFPIKRIQKKYMIDLEKVAIK